VLGHDFPRDRRAAPPTWSLTLVSQVSLLPDAGQTVPLPSSIKSAFPHNRQWHAGKAASVSLL